MTLRNHALATALLVVLVVGLVLPAAAQGVTPALDQPLQLAKGGFGPQLFLVSFAQGQVGALRSLPVAVHATVPGGERYVVSAAPAVADRFTAAGIAFILLDADTTGKVYYFVDASDAGAAELAASFGRSIFEDDAELLLAVPAAGEATFVAALPAHGVRIALLSSVALPPDALFPPPASPARAAAADPTIAGLLTQVTESGLQSLVADLSGERPVNVGGSPVTFASRYTFAGPIRSVEQYIYERYVELSLSPAYVWWTYGGYSGRNVIADIPGALHPERIWLVGGHFDSISDVPYTSAPGADDNATGTAATLLIAAALVGHPFADTIRFVHFSGEEQGMWGSKAYAQALSYAGSQVMGYLDLDMIGYDGDGDRTMELHAGTRENSTALASAFVTANTTYSQGLNVEFKTDTANRFSDHSSFWDYGYAAFMAIENFFDDAIPRDRNPWYHTTSDRLVSVDLSYAVRTARAALAATAELAGLLTGPTPTPTLTSQPSNTPIPSCTEQVANGGFETTGGWTFAVTATQGGYTTAQAHSGARSARLGIAPSLSSLRPAPEKAGHAISDRADPQQPEVNLLGEIAPDDASYSTAYQTVSIPAAANTATLTFWYLPGAESTTGADFQRVLLLNADYSYRATLMQVLQNTSTWRQAAFDLTAYRGQTLVLYFEVYNDDTAAGPRAWLFLDDVSLLACTGVTPTATLSPSATPTATVTQTPSSQPTHTPTATPTVTQTPTSQPTDAPTATPTVTQAPISQPTHTPTATPSPTAPCAEVVRNGGFEQNTAWTFARTATQGDYATVQKHTGTRSAQLGITPGDSGLAIADFGMVFPSPIPNPQSTMAGSYSTAYQTISIPANVRSADLTFWYLPGADATTGADFQRALLLNADYTYRATLLKVLENASTWRQATFDLSPYRGQTLILYFEVYNDDTAAGPRAWLFLDDVSIQSCSKLPATPSSGPHAWLPLILFSP
ncbi:MAG: M28 family peptidase [Chloroflexi bacterium]|nr:M28 family peptidase [Chloroflexota bacterium]